MRISSKRLVYSFFLPPQWTITQFCQNKQHFEKGAQLLHNCIGISTVLTLNTVIFLTETLTSVHVLFEDLQYIYSNYMNILHITVSAIVYTLIELCHSTPRTHILLCAGRRDSFTEWKCTMGILHLNCTCNNILPSIFILLYHFVFHTHMGNFACSVSHSIHWTSRQLLFLLLLFSFLNPSFFFRSITKVDNKCHKGLFFQQW